MSYCLKQINKTKNDNYNKMDVAYYIFEKKRIINGIWFSNLFYGPRI